MNQNQYNIYIDLDEEITIVVGRVHAAKATDLTLIVPQHAVVLQSIINLRLLAREAKKHHKNIVIVTQDEEGAEFAERAGLAVMPLQDWQAQNVTTQEDPYDDALEQSAEDFGRADVTAVAQDGGDELTPHTTPPLQGTKLSVRDADEDHREEDHRPLHEQALHDRDQVNEKPTYTQPQRGGMDIAPVRQKAQNVAPQRQVADEPSVVPVTTAPVQDAPRRESSPVRESSYSTATPTPTTATPDVSPAMTSQPRAAVTNDYTAAPSDYQDSSSVRLGVNDYTQDTTRQREPKIPQKKVSLIKRLMTQKRRSASRKAQQKNVAGLDDMSEFSYFRYGAIIIGIFIGIVILATLVLPYTRIELEVTPITTQQEVALTVRGTQQDLDAERRVIGGRIIEKDIEFTVSAPATGQSTTDAQKAQGVITITNKFSQTPQPLVATTRFTAADGTLFRLAQATTIPGFTEEENGDVIPGEVEALIVADEAGEGGNIAPTSFTIPGFGETSDKYKEITATSGAAMQGGGNSNTDRKTVTQEDLDGAKALAEQGREAYILEEITSLLVPDQEVLLDDAIDQEIVRSESNTTIDSAVESFDYTIASHVRVIVFSHDDVVTVAQEALKASQPRIAGDSTKYEVEYISIEPDFTEGKAALEVTASADVPLQIDEKSFIQDIHGKKHEELTEIVTQKYPIVSNVSVTTYPSFPSFIGQKISRFAWMTRINIAQKQ